MSDAAVVADASAILALLKAEPFRHFDERDLVGAWVSAVNLSEVLAKLQAGGLASIDAEAAVAALDLDVVPFERAQARTAAELFAPTRRHGLSLADRACLALGLQLGKPVVTADRAWADLGVGPAVILIR